MKRRLQGEGRASRARARAFAIAVVWMAANCVTISIWAQTAPSSPPQPAPAASTAPTLTLAAALALARESNRQIRIAELQVQAAQQQASAAKTRLLPQTDVKALGGRLLDTVSAHFPAGALGTVNGSPVPSNDIDIRSSSRFSEAVTVTVAQPITQVPRIKTGIRAAQVGIDIAREEARQKQHTNTAAVRQLYHAILQTKETIAAGNEQLEALNQMERTASENVRQGTLLRVDLLEVQAKREGQEVALSTARDMLQQFKEQMNVLLGRDTQTPFEVAPVADDALMDTDAGALVDRAIRNRPELHLSALQITQAELDRRAKELERIPDLSLAMNYTVLQSDLNAMPDHAWTVGLMFSWDGFDWGRRNHESAAKKRTVEQAKLALDEGRAKVQIEVRNQLRHWREARDTESAARAAQKAAQERVRLTTNQFQAHAALLKDVLQAQAALAEATRQVQEAALASLTARSELRRSIGEE